MCFAAYVAVHQPMAVTMVQGTRAHLALFRRASRPGPNFKRRRAAFKTGTATAAVAAGTFLSEDKFPDTPYIHAAWHLLSAAAIAQLLTVCAE